MSEERKPTEEQVEKIDAIDSYDALGGEKPGQAEHSGGDMPDEPSDLRDKLADNDPGERP